MLTRRRDGREDVLAGRNHIRLQQITAARGQWSAGRESCCERRWIAEGYR
jgi:hypothetical protein